MIFGTRPEAIKMCPLVLKLQHHYGKQVKVCITAQHREMLDQVLNVFSITPDYDLNIMQASQSLVDITSRVLHGVNNIIEIEKPSYVFVHGDTTTTFAATIAAYYHKIKVAHVEAGLRSYQKYAPWPEEINRRAIAPIVDLHFAPTQQAKNNLLSENIAEQSIHVTGNTVIDALLFVKNFITHDRLITKKLQENFSFLHPHKKLILITGHRRENFGEGLQNICFALRKLAEREDLQIVYPVHLNPNVQEPVNNILRNINNIFLLDPIEYIPFVYLLSQAYLVLTDSGGIQEEAPTLGKPVLVLREVTERPEAVLAGTAQLVGTDIKKIIAETEHLLEDEVYYKSIANRQNPYGDGTACEKILTIFDAVNQTKVSNYHEQLIQPVFS